MVELGQRFRVMPYFTGRDAREEKIQTGIVVYVHPKGRYAVLEFDGESGRPREGFFLDQLTQRNRVRQKRGIQA